jgi:hypothetical protein
MGLVVLSSSARRVKRVEAVGVVLTRESITAQPKRKGSIKIDRVVSSWNQSWDKRNNAFGTKCWDRASLQGRPTDGITRYRAFRLIFFRTRAGMAYEPWASHVWFAPLISPGRSRWYGAFVSVHRYHEWGHTPCLQRRLSLSARKTVDGL